jgi:hypothetical protein
MTASGMGGVMRLAGTGVWLAAGAAASFVLALVCSESVHYRSFWPELFASASLGLVLTAVWMEISETAESTAERG